jgi:hypothetical protein
MELTVNPKEFGIEETKANELTSGLSITIAEREVLKENYKSIISLEITEDNLDVFRELRLKIRDNRTKGIEKWHKANKEFFLTGGRFVDAIKNKEIVVNEEMEAKLLEAEKFFENKEKERLKAVHNERVEKLLPFGYDIGNVDFSGMDNNMFESILIGAKKQHEDRVAAEKKAEDERLELIRLEAEAKEKQSLENERLKAENEAKEKQLKAEREAAEKKAAELKAKADAELAEQKRLADLEAKKQAEIISKQKAEADKLAAELKAKADAEEKEKQRKLAEAEALRLAEIEASKAPIKKQLESWVKTFELPKTNIDNVKVAEIQEKFESFKKWALAQSKSI